MNWKTCFIPLGLLFWSNSPARGQVPADYDQNQALFDWPDGQTLDVHRMEAGNVVYHTDPAPWQTVSEPWVELPSALILRHTSLWLVNSPTNYPAFHEVQEYCEDFAVLPPETVGTLSVSRLVLSTPEGLLLYAWDPDSQQLVSQTAPFGEDWASATQLSAIWDGDNESILLVGLSANGSDILRGHLTDTSFCPLSLMRPSGAVQRVVPLEFDPGTSGIEIAYVTSAGMRIVEAGNLTNVLSPPNYPTLAAWPLWNGFRAMERNSSGGQDGDSVVYIIYDNTNPPGIEVAYEIELDGLVQPGVTSSATFRTSDLKLARFDEDGRNDLIASSKTEAWIYTLHGLDNDLTEIPFWFEDEETAVVPLFVPEYWDGAIYNDPCLPEEPMIACADFDGDGDGDLVIASSNCDSLSVAPGQSNDWVNNQPVPFSAINFDLVDEPYDISFNVTVPDAMFDAAPSGNALNHLVIEAWIRADPQNGSTYVLPGPYFFLLEPVSQPSPNAPYVFPVTFSQDELPSGFDPETLLIYVQCTGVHIPQNQGRPTWSSTSSSYVHSATEEVLCWLFENEPDEYSFDCLTDDGLIQNFHRRTAVSPWATGTGPYGPPQ